VRTRVVANVTKDNLKAVLKDMVSPAATLHTDESGVYADMALHYARHETVNHSIKEYARGDVTTNHAEGFFGRLERSQHAQGHGRRAREGSYPDERGEAPYAAGLTRRR
jgi:hypothetical protein